jgi:hypothetical protein
VTKYDIGIVVPGCPGGRPWPRKLHAGKLHRPLFQDTQMRSSVSCRTGRRIGQPLKFQSSCTSVRGMVRFVTNAADTAGARPV